MSNTSVKNNTSKFTRGEKCILIHIAITVFVIVVLVIIFVIHLCLVRHSVAQIFSVTRKSLKSNRSESWGRVGAVIVRDSGSVCGCILLRRRWSLAPAHCVAARANPTFAHLLPSWALRYDHPKHVATPIDRGVIHSQYNKDDNQNNVGLFEHKDQNIIGDFAISPVAIDDNALHTNELTVIGLKIDTSGTGSITQVHVSPIATDTCRQQVLPVAELHSYEICTMMMPGWSLDHGATLMINSHIKGFFTWGDKHGYFPLVMLDISHFKDWIESIVN